MSTTDIEWTKRPGTVGVTWNVTTGCNKVDRGCKNCYAEVMHRRLQAMGQPKYHRNFGVGAIPWYPALEEPRRWKKPRTVFVNSMSDLFHPQVEFNFLIQVFAVIRDTPQHTYLVLTKRPERALEFQEWMEACDLSWSWPPNVWLGTSVNDQPSANKRIPLLLMISARVHFVSYEPATGPVDFTAIEMDGTFGIDALKGVLYFKESGLRKDSVYPLDWVIMGGESGPKADAMRIEWARATRADCEATKTAFFFKQWGLWQPFDFQPEEGVKYNVRHFADGGAPMYRSRKKSFNLLDGQRHQQFPA